METINGHGYLSSYEKQRKTAPVEHRILRPNIDKLIVVQFDITLQRSNVLEIALRIITYVTPDIEIIGFLHVH